MWSVLEGKSASKQLDKAPREILEAYEFWKNVAINSGPAGLINFPGFKDHALKGQWMGARSSYLNIKWRVIYTLAESRLEVLVLEVNAHDYRKKR